MNKIITWLVVVVVIIAGGIFLFNSGSQNPKSNSDNQQATGSEAQNVPVTGNIDDVSAAILNAVAGDDMTPDITDPNLLDSGSAELNSFDQSFDASGL